MNIGGPISGTAGPKITTYTAPDPTVGFGSIVVYNSSGSAVNVYVGQTGTQGLPSFSVSPNVVATYPIPGAPYVTVAFATFPTTGQVAVNLTDAVLSAASSVLPGSVGGAGVFPAATQMFTYNMVKAAAGPALYTTGILANYGQSIYIYSYALTAFNATPNSTALISLYQINLGGDLLSWMLYAQQTAGAEVPLNIALSGGPLPLLIIGPNFSPQVNVESIGATTVPSLYFALSFTYAQF